LEDGGVSAPRKIRDCAHIDVDGVSRIIAIEFKKSKHCGLPLCRRHHGAGQFVPDNPTAIPEFGALLSKFSFHIALIFESEVAACATEKEEWLNEPQKILVVQV
jgi:hypothetical protein